MDARADAREVRSEKAPCMSHHFKPPKAYIHQGNPQARLRKSIMTTIKNQAALDAFLGAMPPNMREIAMERVRPYLSFEPSESLSSLDKVEVEACES